MEIYDLIKISDELDEMGLTKEAEFIDSIIKISEKKEIPIGLFVDDLKKIFTNFSKGKAFSKIKSALPEIFRILDIFSRLQDHKFKEMAPSHELESLSPAPAVMLAEHTLARQEDIDDIQIQIKQTKDPIKLKQLQGELESIVRELKGNFNEIAKLRNEDVEEFREFVKHYDKLRMSRKINYNPEISAFKAKM